MKIYTKEIVTCQSCPMFKAKERQYDDDWCLYFSDRLIPNINEIPAWCPLPDKREEKKK